MDAQIHTVESPDEKMESPALMFIQLEELRKSKLYHQLSLKLLEYVQHPKVLANEDLKKLYVEFIEPIENKVNPLTLMKILSGVVSQYKDHEEVIKFLNATEEKVRSDKEAFIYCKLLIGEVYLNKMNKSPIAFKILEEVEDLLFEVDEISTVHNRYYGLASQYRRKMGHHTEYYNMALKYLGSMDFENLSTKERSEHAFMLCLASLLSKDIYNLGELLQHPILEVLKGGSKEWLLDLLNAFCYGKLLVFKDMENRWATIPDLLVNKQKLVKKITLLRLVEIVFNRSPHERRFKFCEIADECMVDITDVEVLVMRSFSIGLLKGSIDEVDQEVSFTWIKPRVVDKDRIKVMVSQLDNWLESIETVSQQLQEGIAIDKNF